MTLYALGTPNYEFVKACARDLKRVKAVFQTYLEDIDEVENASSLSDNYKQKPSSVFIVHGHDEALKQAVARLVEKQGINAIILHEQPNKGATIIEKIERYSDVGAAICLFTSDDAGKGKDEKTENGRARQNVVFEAGFFMGNLGRDHVVIVAESGIELPSDLEGVVYTNSKMWKIEVLQELKEMGFSIDLNKIV